MISRRIHLYNYDLRETLHLPCLNYSGSTPRRCGIYLTLGMQWQVCGPNRAEPGSPLGPAHPARDLTRLGSLFSRPNLFGPARAVNTLFSSKRTFVLSGFPQRQSSHSDMPEPLCQCQAD